MYSTGTPYAISKLIRRSEGSQTTRVKKAFWKKGT